MIVLFKHKGRQILYKTGSAKEALASRANRLHPLLAYLDAADSPQCLNLPELRLHPLKSQWQSYFAINVSGTWRVIFRFIGTDVQLIDYLDYH